MKIKLYQDDIPKNLKLGKIVAIDTEAMGLNHKRDRLCLVQLSSGNKTCHLVKINDISVSQVTSENSKIKNKYSIIIVSFYDKKWANSLIELLVNENIKKGLFEVNKLSNNNYQLLTGPYTSINSLKNDYFKLNKYGFDNLDLKKTK